uniref:Uncharacterized protein n=1 Tax=Romanomermis culicivorax TaxID=13658 RepID=A0A915L3H1_ROMCU
MNALYAGIFSSKNLNDQVQIIVQFDADRDYQTFQDSDQINYLRHYIPERFRSRTAEMFKVLSFFLIFVCDWFFENSARATVIDDYLNNYMVRSGCQQDSEGFPKKWLYMHTFIKEDNKKKLCQIMAKGAIILVMKLT